MKMLIYITTVNSELFVDTKKNCPPYLSGVKSQNGTIQTLAFWLFWLGVLIVSENDDVTSCVEEVHRVRSGNPSLGQVGGEEIARKRIRLDSSFQFPIQYLFQFRLYPFGVDILQWVFVQIYWCSENLLPLTKCHFQSRVTQGHEMMKMTRGKGIELS